MTPIRTTIDTVKRALTKHQPTGPFEAVRQVGLALPGVEALTKYDGSPVLKLAGCFLAGLATHRSAESGSLVVRMTIEDRDLLIADAPDTYYVTDYYRPYPIVLARLARVDRAALHDLLSVSWRLTAAKTRKSIKSRTAGSDLG